MANVLGCSVGSGSVRKPGKRTFSWVDEEIMKVRNPFAGLLALFFVVAWCLSGSAAFAKPLVPLRTAWLGEHETFLVWYAREKGWDKAEGLDLELLPFESGKNVIDEMQSSNWAIAGVGAMPALTASLSSRLYIVGIGNDESASNAIFTRADSPILKMKGFNPNCPEVYGNPGSVRGKTFIVPKGTSAHYMLSRWLHVLGLNERDVNIVDMQPSEAMKAFADGQGDAIALWAPQTFEAEKLGLSPLARIVGHTTHAGVPAQFPSAPVGAMNKLFAKTGWTATNVDLYEINEAFAVVTMAAIHDLKLDPAKVNIHGGACALGHPIGASGARIVVTLLGALRKYGLKRGVASLCIGGGEATALAVEML